MGGGTDPGGKGGTYEGVVVVVGSEESVIWL